MGLGEAGDGMGEAGRSEVARPLDSVSVRASYQHEDDSEYGGFLGQSVWSTCLKGLFDFYDRGGENCVPA